MANKTTNIIVGAAALYLSAKDNTTWGATPPSVSTVAAGAPIAAALEADATNWRGVGFTKDGLELAYAPDYGDVEVDQLLDSALVFKQGLKVTLNTTFAEATLENLLVAWGQSGNTYVSSAAAADVTKYGSANVATGDSVLAIASGALGDYPVERQLVAVGPGPRTAAGGKRERVYNARRVLSVDSSSHGLKRNDSTVFPVSFRLLPDPSAPVGAEYGIIRDRNLS